MGAVPIKVDIPPIVAAYAIPIKSALSKNFFSWGLISGIVLETTPQTARPIGSNMSVTEVFITHILDKAATSIKPPTSLAPLVPTAMIIFKASRL